MYSGKGTLRGVFLLSRDGVLEEHGRLDVNFGWLVEELRGMRGANSRTRGIF